MMMRIVLWLTLAALVAPAAAEPRATPRLLAGWAEPDGRRVAGLSLTMAPGWKTYWRVPGEAGFAPRFDWTGSGNVAALEVIWPSPTPFTQFGMTSFGYADRMLLPLQVTPADPAAPLALRLTFDFGVCEAVCVPETATLALDIPPGAPPEAAGPIALSLSDTPRPLAQAGARVAECALTAADGGLRLAARLAFDGPAPEAVAVVEAAPARFAPAAVTRDGDALLIAAEAEGAAWADRGAARLTLFTDAGAFTQAGCPPG